MTGDIKVRFPNRRAADTSYEQQQNQQNNRDTQSARILGYSGQVCPTLIPTSHSGETSQDDFLHKVCISCLTFRGKDSNGINLLCRDNLHEIYDKLFDIDAEAIEIPENYYTTIANATKAAGEGHTSKLDPRFLLYLFEYYRISKIGGANNPYACAEWPGVQIPQAILSLLDRKGLLFTFFNYKRKGEDHTLLFYERNPAGRGLNSTTTQRTSPTSSGRKK